MSLYRWNKKQKEKMHRSFIGIVITAMQWIKEHDIDKANQIAGLPS